MSGHPPRPAGRPRQTGLFCAPPLASAKGAADAPKAARFAPDARLARLREALPPGNAIAGSICAANLWWLWRLIYPAFTAFVAAAARGWCSAEATRRIMTCLMPSTRKPARSMGLNAACTSGLASWRLVIWGLVTL
jgi:hypothetical protein